MSMPGPHLVKISALAELSGVPSATVKHYLREGLLPEPALKTSRNMAYYDVGLVARIKTIKRLQSTYYLPLRVIKEVLDVAGPEADDAKVASTIARVLTSQGSLESMSEAELIAEGVPESDLAWLKSLGLVTPTPGPRRRGDGAGLRSRARGTAQVLWYSGDDLALVRTLRAARDAGLTPEMLPASILASYLDALRALVEAELKMFRVGVVPKAGLDLESLTAVATTLSEQLVVLLRRKLLIPTLASLARAEPPPAKKRRAR